MAYSNSPAQDYVQSDYTNSARLNVNGSAQEQKFIENLIVETKKAVSDVKKFAVSEVWKILQLLTAVIIQLIENFATELSGPEK